MKKCSIASLLWKHKRMPLRHPYGSPQESTGDVYLMVGFGARALHLTMYPILSVSYISAQSYGFSWK